MLNYYLSFLNDYQCKIKPLLNLPSSCRFCSFLRALLKKKNSNDLLQVSYYTQRRPNEFLTLALSSSAGYKLSKKFYLNVDVMTSWFHTKVSFEKELKNLNTNFLTIEKIDYNKHLFTFSGGAGLIFVIY